MKILIGVLVVLGMAVCPIFAGSITDIGLFDTGQGGGATDPHYTILGTGAAAIVTPVPAPPWLDNSAGSAKWISNLANVFGVSTTVDLNYTYWTTFDLSLYDTSTVVIGGRWAVDDYGAIHMNGSGTPITGTSIAFNADGSQYNGWHTFTIDSNSSGGFLQGSNLLAIGVNNKGQVQSFNPAGVIVEWTSFEGTLLEGVPEPSTLALLGGGLLALGFLRRRR